MWYVYLQAKSELLVRIPPVSLLAPRGKFCWVDSVFKPSSSLSGRDCRSIDEVYYQPARVVLIVVLALPLLFSETERDNLVSPVQALLACPLYNLLRTQWDEIKGLSVYSLRFLRSTSRKDRPRGVLVTTEPCSRGFMHIFAKTWRYSSNFASDGIFFSHALSQL